MDATRHKPTFLRPDLSDSLISAKSLLGFKLVHDSPHGQIAGYIVETEAYNQDDPASHTYGGPKGRNRVMYGPAGTVYVYFTYGMHHCLNIVTGPVGRGEAVLIRAIEPYAGIEIMRRNRGAKLASDRLLTSGPGRLTQAYGIDRSHNGTTLGTVLRLEPGITPQTITQTTRIGISRASENPWRFYIAGNQFVSRL